MTLWFDWHPYVAIFHVAPLHRRPGDAMHDRFAVRVPRVLPLGIVECGKVYGLCMRRQMAAHGIRQVVGGQVWHVVYDAITMGPSAVLAFRPTNTSLMSSRRFS